MSTETTERTYREQSRLNPLPSWIGGLLVLVVVASTVFIFEPWQVVSASDAQASDPGTSTESLDLNPGGAFLISELEDLAKLEKAMSRLQAKRNEQLAHLDHAVLAEPESPVLLWDAIERTARRHKCSLDYFLGFGF